MYKKEVNRRCKVGRADADSELCSSALGGAMEMQRCYNISNLLSTLISTQRKKPERGTGTEGWRGGGERWRTPNDR